MATAEPAPSSLGPRYAPDDPSLPKPWKGLIDGSTGLLYYWNPETNITQYEKPSVLPPPLPPGPPPEAATPKLAPIPVTRTMQTNGGLAHHGQQINQTQQQQGQQVAQTSQQQGPPMSQFTQQHGQIMTQQQGPLGAAVSHQQGPQMVQSVQQPGVQYGQALQQPGPQTPQKIVQHPGQQMLSQPLQPISQLTSQQLSQLGPQTTQLLGQKTPQHQGSHMAQAQVHQYPHQQMQYNVYQQHVLPPGQHNSQQQTPHIAQCPPFQKQQEFKVGFPQREEIDFHQGSQIGFSPSQIQKTGSFSSQNLSAGVKSFPMPQTGGPTGQSQPCSGPSASMQQQHGPQFQNQIGPGMMHSQQPNMPPAGLKRGYDDNPHGRSGNDYYFSADKEGPHSVSQQSKLASIPPTRNPQEMRMGGLPVPNVPLGQSVGLNAVAGQAMHNTYSHATCSTGFLNNAMVRPPSMKIGSSDNSTLSPAEVYRQQHEVTATGENVPPPLMTFEATGFPPEILREIYSAGFSSPTPIQAQTWPIALQGRDIVAIAKTGSGKTLGYLIPACILLRQRRTNPQKGPTVLVLAPTRELATQIQDEAIKFGRSSRVSCTCLYGGAPKGPQLKELDRGADIVVATPGRLNDILEMKKIDFGQISLLVLDEADRMLDMGFEPQIHKIVNEIPPHRQTLMYTATWPKEVRKIAGDLLVNPVQVNIGSVDELAANKAITQYVEVVPPMEKQRRLEQILRSQERGSKAIIFCSTKRLCDQLARSIGRNFGAAAIHGDKSQVERDWVLNQFRSGKSPILVATDVAARGLDIKDIRVVINYDFPTGIEDYVHRIGRTGRAGATGVSYTFFSDQDWKYAADLIKVLEGANQHVPPEVRDMALRNGPGFGKDRGGVNRLDSGGGGRWDSGGRGGGMRDGGYGGGGSGMRDGGFGGRGGMRDGGFGGRGGLRDGGFGGRGGMRDGSFGGRGGMRDGAVGGHNGRNEFFSGRGNRGRGFAGPGGGNVGWGRNDRGFHDRHSNMDGRGRGRGRGRFDNRRDITNRGRGRNYSSSPEKVRTWGYSSSSRSRSRSRSWSRSRSRSPRRSHSCSRSPRVSRSPGHSRHSQSQGNDRYGRSYDRHYDQQDHSQLEPQGPPEPVLSPMSPGTQGFPPQEPPGVDLVAHPPVVETTEKGHPLTGDEPFHQPPPEP